MIITSHDNKITYVHTPKTGSRTMLGLFALAYNPLLWKTNRKYFDPKQKQANGTYPELRKTVMEFQSNKKLSSLSINEWKEITTEKPLYTICIVRDPIKRFISAYTNRVLFHENLKDKPDFNTFVNNFEHYYNTNGNIKTHFQPQVDFIGKDESQYTHIFNTADFEKVFTFFEKVYRHPFPRFKLQSGGAEYKKDIKLTNKHKNFIKDFYIEDYQFLENHENS